MSNYKVLGLMSGTSLDGLDIAYCIFIQRKNKWKYSIEKAITYHYPDKWWKRLKNAHRLTAYELIKLHNEYGAYIGDLINTFLNNINKKVDLISSHGHTIYHQPADNLTFQAGSGMEIARRTNITTISDFRSLDVLRGGQGAPLVPVGDKYLFSEYSFCINLGGFANISFDYHKERIAFDICAVNFIINYLTSKVGAKYDKDGGMATKGKINQSLLEKLNNLEYYNIPPPKSLGREWVESELIPTIEMFDISIYDKIRTIYEHIAIQIYMVLQKYRGGNILLTGGGAKNTYLVELIKKYIDQDVVIPNPLIIDYKEALIFAFLGVLRIRNEINCFKTVTGASEDSIVGTLHQF